MASYRYRCWDYLPFDKYRCVRTVIQTSNWQLDGWGAQPTVLLSWVQAWLPLCSIYGWCFKKMRGGGNHKAVAIEKIWSVSRHVSQNCRFNYQNVSNCERHLKMFHVKDLIAYMLHSMISLFVCVCVSVFVHLQIRQLNMQKTWQDLIVHCDALIFKLIWFHFSSECALMEILYDRHEN